MLNLSRLNDAQREAVMHGEGPALVIAGPGSGKTLVITQRIRYLIEEQRVSPDRILVITFTKEAAVSMQQRFQESNTSYLPVHFGTFHSIFYHILREYNHSNAFNILTQKQKCNLLLPILKNIPLDKNPYDARESIQDDIISILSAISYYKNTGEKISAIACLSEEWRCFFDTLFDEYEYARQKEHAIDFDDMVYECKRILQEKEHVRLHWQNYFSHILIDEFQDINPMQYEVVKMLSKQPYSIFAVGDDDQSIYGFRGSNPACLQQFCKDYRAKQIYLNINYRSNPKIVEVSLKVINENKNRFIKKLIANSAYEQHNEEKHMKSWDVLSTMEMKKKDIKNKLQGVVKLQAYQERNEQYESLCEQIREYLADNPNSTCAVLFRTNSYMQSLAAMLNRKGIPYRMKERAMCVYDNSIVKDIMAYMKLANEGLRRDLFLQIMNKPVRYISRNALSSGEISFEKMQAYYREYGDRDYRISIMQELEQLQKQLINLKGKTPYLAVKYIRKVMGYERYIREQKYRNHDKWEKNMEILEWIGEDAKGYSSYEDWMLAQNAYREKVLNGKAPDEAAQNNQAEVQLMTVHASKGLEFDKVWIPNCNEKVFPHGSMSDESQVEEERRIFYVGLTRAKENLELMYLVGTKERPRMPSRFLNPIIEDIENYSSSSTNSSNSQLSKYSSNASATFSYSSSSSMKLNSGSSLGSSGFSL